MGRYAFLISWYMAFFSFLNVYYKQLFLKAYMFFFFLGHDTLTFDF